LSRNGDTLFQHMKKINRGHNSNSFIPLAAQEIEVSGNNEMNFTGYGAGENMVIRRVFFDYVGDSFWNNEFSNTRDKLKVVNYITQSLQVE
jgi:hypothetical protein